MKWKVIAPIALVAVIAVGGIVAWQLSSQAGDAGGDGSTSGATLLPVDSNPISNDSTAPGLTITEAAVEDNVDPATDKAIDDRLQLTLENSTDTELSGLEIYYEMTDATTGQSEAYYLPLEGLTIAPKSEETVFFDNGSEPGHYPENRFSIYRNSTNKVDFTIEVSAPGLKIATATTSKEAGAGEQPD